jgi:hypothetical protein
MVFVLFSARNTTPTPQTTEMVPSAATTLDKTQIAPLISKSPTKKYFAKNSQNLYVKFCSL